MLWSSCVGLKVVRSGSPKNGSWHVIQLKLHSIHFVLTLILVKPQNRYECVFGYHKKLQIARLIEEYLVLEANATEAVALNGSSSRVLPHVGLRVTKWTRKNQIVTNIIFQMDRENVVIHLNDGKRPLENVTLPFENGIYLFRLAPSSKKACVRNAPVAAVSIL